MVRDDVAVGVDDEAGADAARALLTLAAPPSGGCGKNRRNGSGTLGVRERRTSPAVRTLTTAGVSVSASRIHG